MAEEQSTPGGIETLLGQKNLVAWCIVPFDAAKRGLVERAKMLKHAAGAGVSHQAPPQRLRREELRLEDLLEDDDRLELLDLVDRLGAARELDERLGARLEREELALERLEEAELRAVDERLGARLELDDLGWDLARKSHREKTLGVANS
jgi:hypothetical protein